MFGTLHWNSQTKEAEFVERPYGSSDPEKNSACDRCRAKKVKCSTNYDGCSRCKRLGKPCTLSSIKHKGQQRKRKSTMNRDAEQESSMDLLIQSWDSSSPKAIGNSDGVSSDQQSLASSLPSETNDDKQQTQQPFVDIATEKSADFDSNFDLAFFTEFGQQRPDHDGDSIFNFTLSPLPWPFSPTSHPSTPIPPIVARPLLPSPSLSPGEEMPCYFPPMSETEEFSFFDIDSTATPVELRTPATCNCLSKVVFAVERFEASANAGNRAELDSIVAYEKEAIKCCRRMLKCSICMEKRENLVLLVFMTEKIVTACGRIVVLYRMKDNSRDITMEGTSPSLSSSSASSIRNECTPTDLIMSKTMPMDTSSDWQELLLGDYEINSSLEWEHLVRVLIFLQLRAVMDLLTDMKSMGSKILGETQMAILMQAGLRVGELEKDVYVI